MRFKILTPKEHQAHGRKQKALTGARAAAQKIEQLLKQKLKQKRGKP